MEICKISLASNGSFPRTDSLGGASYWQLEGPEELLTVFRPQSRGLDFIQHKWSCFIYSSGLMAKEECSLAAHDSHSPVPDTRPNTWPCPRNTAHVGRVPVLTCHLEVRFWQAHAASPIHFSASLRPCCLAPSDKLLWLLNLNGSMSCQRAIRGLSCPQQWPRADACEEHERCNHAPCSSSL